MTWLRPAQVFDGERLAGGIALRVENGVVAELRPAGQVQEWIQPISGTVSPGFVDLQVNGGGGVLLNTQPDAEGMAAIRKAHHGLGTAAILPTVITDAPQVLERAADAALAARGQPGIAGLHIEGPHLAPERRGTHDARHLRPLDERTMTLCARLRAGGVTVLLTLAPEMATPAQIAALSREGVIVSLGHSAASPAQVQEALAAGARCFTHLYNAMPPLAARAPGIAGTAIASEAYAGLICDGIHVSAPMAQLAIRARPRPDRSFIVSDAMATVGGPPEFSLYDSRIRLQDGRLVNDEGNLAGAHSWMAAGAAWLVSDCAMAPEDALRMGITVPAELIGRADLARLEGRPLAETALLDSALRFKGWLSAAV